MGRKYLVYVDILGYKKKAIEIATILINFLKR
jgi:hypothetical protein